MIIHESESVSIDAKRWSSIATVFVRGVAGQKERVAQNSQKENGRIVASWKNVAVLRATSDHPVMFFAGYYNTEGISFLRYELTSNLDFGMRIGPGDVNFFVFPKDLTSPLQLELIE